MIYDRWRHAHIRPHRQEEPVGTAGCLDLSFHSITRLWKDDYLDNVSRLHGCHTRERWSRTHVLKSLSTSLLTVTSSVPNTFTSPKIGDACWVDVKGRPASRTENGREALGAPRDRRAAVKELDGASDILRQKYLRASKEGAGKELSSLDYHH